VQLALLIALDSTCCQELTQASLDLVHELLSQAEDSTLVRRSAWEIAGVNIDDEKEQYIARVLPWLKNQTPTLQCRFLALLEGGSRQSAVIARWLAWTILTGIDHTKVRSRVTLPKQWS
jgi:hypothetical protein